VAFAFLSFEDVLARVPGVKLRGDYARYPCPVHRGRGRNAWARRLADGGAKLGCFSHQCPPREIADAIRGYRIERSFVELEQRCEPGEAERSEYARSIWRESHGIAGTPAAKYLAGRGITIGPASLRCHPRLRHKPSGRFFPAMVAAVQIDHRITSVHRTYLRPDGAGKADVEPNKMMLGPVMGGAVRLGPVAGTVCLAEGIETGLSVLQASGVSTWAALSTSGLLNILLPPEIRTVIICADHDLNGAGQRAAQQAAMRLLRQDPTRRVRIALPPTAGDDFNSMLVTV
jgi:phage/plasmid primase-like uncharacterized protein